MIVKVNIKWYEEKLIRIRNINEGNTELRKEMVFKEILSNTALQYTVPNQKLKKQILN